MLKGVEAIFLVTNYWEHLFTGKTAVQSGQAEAAQALTVIKIAATLPGLKHFIWSTLPGNAKGVRMFHYNLICRTLIIRLLRIQPPSDFPHIKRKLLIYFSKQNVLQSNISTLKPKSM